MQNQEKIKKLLIIIIALALFGASYYYYVNKQKKTSVKQVQKPEFKQLKVVSKKSEPVKKISNITKNIKPNLNQVKKEEIKEVVTPKKEVIVNEIFETKKFLKLI